MADNSGNEKDLRNQHVFIVTKLAVYHPNGINNIHFKESVIRYFKTLEFLTKHPEIIDPTFYEKTLKMITEAEMILDLLPMSDEEERKLYETV